MVTISWTNEALDDLQQIAEYLDQRSYALSAATVQAIFDRIENLEKFPKIGRVVPEFKLEFVREIIYSNYRIVYHIIDTYRIDIIAIHHSSRPLRK